MSIRARSSDELRNAREKGACCRNRRERLQSGRLGGAVNTGPLSFVVKRMERYRNWSTSFRPSGLPYFPFPERIPD